MRWLGKRLTGGIGACPVGGRARWIGGVFSFSGQMGSLPLAFDGGHVGWWRRITMHPFIQRVRFNFYRCLLFDLLKCSDEPFASLQFHTFKMFPAQTPLDEYVKEQEQESLAKAVAALQERILQRPMAATPLPTPPPPPTPPKPSVGGRWVWPTKVKRTIRKIPPWRFNRVRRVPPWR